MYHGHYKFMSRHCHMIFFCCADNGAADGVYFCTSAIPQVSPDRSTTIWILDRSVLYFFDYRCFVKNKTGSSCSFNGFVDKLAAELPCVGISSNISHIYLKDSGQCA